MAEKLTLALDAMGGDHAPDMVVEGVAMSRERFPDVRYLLFGDRALLEPLLGQHPELEGMCEIRHTEERISGEMKPSQALRQGKQSSMRLAINAVHEGEADAVVSAGNTGALMAMSKFVLQMMSAIDRPAIVAYFPNREGETVMLDLGANVECDANNLIQFSIMGAIFARTVLGLQDPIVGLLNIGEEELKGNQNVKAAHTVLSQGILPFRYHGFVEGDGIHSGAVDVVVTDGWTGNVALKTMEGTANLFGTFVSRSFRSSLMARIGYLFASHAFGKMKIRLDPRHYNGAVLVGLRGISVKSHGGTDALGFSTAIAVAIDMVNNRFIENIREQMGKLDPEQIETLLAGVE